MTKFCDDCLNPTEDRVYHKGRRLCQNCFGRQFKTRSFRHTQSNATLKDLKRHLEKDW